MDRRRKPVGYFSFYSSVATGTALSHKRDSTVNASRLGSDHFYTPDWTAAYSTVTAIHRVRWISISHYSIDRPAVSITDRCVINRFPPPYLHHTFALHRRQADLHNWRHSLPKSVTYSPMTVPRLPLNCTSNQKNVVNDFVFFYSKYT